MSSRTLAYQQDLMDYASAGDWISFRNMFVSWSGGIVDNPTRTLRRIRVRERYERLRASASRTIHTIPPYAFPRYVPEHNGPEHGPCDWREWRAAS